MNKIMRINTLVEKHKFWSNPLLNAIRENRLVFNELRYFFSQYYYYSKNFTRLLANIMMKCEDVSERNIIAENLLDESGIENNSLSHAEIYKLFLHSLNIDSLEQIKFDQCTINFVQCVMNSCSNAKYDESLAILTFAIENTVSRLYKIFIKGLKNIGLTDKQLEFFKIHIACDDIHSENLIKILEQQTFNDSDINRLSKKVDDVLNIRDEYLKQIYQNLTNAKLESLINELQVSKNKENIVNNENISKYIIDPFNNGVPLYFNEDDKDNLHFNVNRVMFPTSVIDSRVLTIFAGAQTELHKHAHESIFFVLTGKGRVYIGENIIEIFPKNMVYVPRWVEHKTENITDEKLIILAITDYGLTKRFSKNTEASYRKKADNVNLLADYKYKEKINKFKNITVETTVCGFEY